MAKKFLIKLSGVLQKKALKSALLGADWFKNNQVDLKDRPCRNANGGRFMYNGHRYSNHQTLGIDWTSARAIFILMQAYKVTKKREYLESVKKGLDYAYSLQVLDKRNKSLFGVFHEETPQSFWLFPRDGIELADAFIDYYLITKDKEALYRAEIFLDWFVKETVFQPTKGRTWIYREVKFDGFKDTRIASCEGGNTMALAHGFQVIGKPKYKALMKKLMDAQIEMYHQNPGPFVTKSAKTKENHHETKDGVIDNDDGAGIGLLCAYDLLNDRKYLDHAISLADYHVSKNGKYAFYCALPAATTFLLEVARFTGKKEYLDAASSNIEGIFKMQHIEAKNKKCHGAFIGEDEGGINYVPGFTPKPEDMVTTRSTAFACLALFKAAGTKQYPLGYSVL